MYICIMLKYLVCISFFFIVSKSVLEYGEFDLVLKKNEMCNGPKRNTCVETKVEIVNITFMKCDLLVKRDMKVIKGKIIGSLNGKELLRVQFMNMCNHFFLGPLLQTLMNETDRCGLFKGHYLLNIDIQKIARNFYGGKFMYGNWTFKMLFYNDQCNMHCAVLDLSLTPRRSVIGDKQ